MSQRSIRLALGNDQARITIARPDRRNALTFEGWAELRDAVREVSAGPARVLIVDAEGEDFCLGGDLEQDHTPSGHSLEQMAWVGQACQALAEAPQPTISRVQGVAVGAGFGLALAADFVLAARTARFGTLFTARGLSPDFGTSWVLPRLVGLGLARRLCLLPDLFDAERALALGLVHDVADPADLDGAVGALAARLAAGPPLAYRLTKQLLNASLSSTLGMTLQAEAAAQTINRSSADALEGIASFVERRPPRFQGR
jgi:2-(1,2-epoxy-1,2-dihydrophenyl)acetyl-CoA isomerase